MKYTKIRPGQAEAGDIVRLPAYTINDDGTRPKWELIKLSEQPNNNGTIRGKDKHGRHLLRHLTHAAAVYRPEGRRTP